ncbi:MAG: SDR family NAD(P)-dependent oxidoreductase, partial [Mesorhizobium sp.]
MSAAKNVLLVTGGGRGIGAATSRLAAKAGYRVAVNYATNEAAAAALVEA